MVEEQLLVVVVLQDSEDMGQGPLEEEEVRYKEAELSWSLQVGEAVAAA
jgi:hypothetical protein